MTTLRVLLCGHHIAERWEARNIVARHQTPSYHSGPQQSLKTKPKVHIAYVIQAVWTLGSHVWSEST